MSPCHNLEPSLVARDSSRLLSVKPNQWMHLSPFYARVHGEWLRYAKSTSQFHWQFLFSQRWSGLPSKSPMSSWQTSPFPPSGNGGYVRNLDVFAGDRSVSLFVMLLFHIASCGLQIWITLLNIALGFSMESVSVLWPILAWFYTFLEL